MYFSLGGIGDVRWSELWAKGREKKYPKKRGEAI